jgi:Fur family ferric uptake transcriptional regulator
MADVDCVVGDGPCLELPAVAGYAIDEVQVIFRGLCPACGSSVDAAGRGGVR